MSGVLPFWRSSLGKKVVMATTGAILVAYIISHVAANLLVYAGPEWINGYGALLHSTGPLLWVARAVLLVAFALHVTAAVQLARRARAARPRAYGAYEPQTSTLSARTIRWGGAVLFVFVVLHVLHLTTGTLHPAFRFGDDYGNVVRGFGVWWVIPAYLVAVAAMAFHLYHGAWSAVRTLGVGAAGRTWRRAAAVLALFVGLGFASIPLAVAAGVLR